LDNARETWIMRGTAILIKGFSPNDTRSVVMECIYQSINKYHNRFNTHLNSLP
jgi:hypothetical protein